MSIKWFHYIFFISEHHAAGTLLQSGMHRHRYDTGSNRCSLLVKDWIKIGTQPIPTGENIATIGVRPELQYLDVPLLPGLCDVAGPSSAVDHLHVPRADLGGTHGHEVRPRAADGELGQVGERLADGGSKQEGAHYLVERGHVLVKVRIGVNPLAVDQISFSRGDLRG